MTWLSEIKFTVLRWRLKRAYRRWEREFDKWGCGIALACELSPKMARLETEFNALHAACKKLEGKP